MREILFRGKRVDNNEWVYGFLSKSRGNNHFLSLCIDHEENGVMLSSIVEPETIGQYTGLTDRNGKRIFEGDILVENGYRFLVVFDQKWAKFKLRHDNKAIQYPEWNRGVEMEIIGNIHDNPEYLGGVHPEPPQEPAP